MITDHGPIKWFLGFQIKWNRESVVVSHPDMAYAVGNLSQFIQNPGPVHWEALKRVISYLGSMKNYWLTFGGNEKGTIQGFFDADWASQQHRHSISGFSFHFGQGAVSWSSKKQAVVRGRASKSCPTLVLGLVVYGLHLLYIAQHYRLHYLQFPVPLCVSKYSCLS